MHTLTHSPLTTFFLENHFFQFFHIFAFKQNPLFAILKEVPILAFIFIALHLEKLTLI